MALQIQTEVEKKPCYIPAAGAALNKTVLRELKINYIIDYLAAFGRRGAPYI